jgi:hypothetical protein
LRKQTRTKINKAKATFTERTPTPYTPSATGHPEATELQPVEESRVAKGRERHKISEMIRTKRGP